jgi:hypothetical protein
MFYDMRMDSTMVVLGIEWTPPQMTSLGWLGLVGVWACAPLEYTCDPGRNNCFPKKRKSIKNESASASPDVRLSNSERDGWSTGWQKTMLLTICSTCL